MESRNPAEAAELDAQRTCSERRCDANTGPRARDNFSQQPRRLLHSPHDRCIRSRFTAGPVLTASTPFDVSAVRLTSFASFGVVKFPVFTGHATFCSGFDSRQLHREMQVRVTNSDLLSFPSTDHSATGSARLLRGAPCPSRPARMPWPRDGLYGDRRGSWSGAPVRRVPARPIRLLDEAVNVQESKSCRIETLAQSRSHFLYQLLSQLVILFAFCAQALAIQRERSGHLHRARVEPPAIGGINHDHPSISPPPRVSIVKLP